MKLSKHRGETGEACGVARKIVPVTMPHVYKVPILVFGEWKYQLPWKQQKRKSYQLPPSELFLEAGRLQSKEIEHNHDTARGTHTHTSQKTERTRANTLAHAHTHTNTNAAYAWQNIVCSWFLQIWQNSIFLLAGFQLRFRKRVLRSFPCLDSLDYSSGPSDFARWCVWLTLQKGKQPFCKTVLFSAFWANSLVSQKYDPFSKYTTLNYEI